MDRAVTIAPADPHSGDPVLRQGRVLLDADEAAAALRVALTPAGAELDAVRPTQVRYQRGRRLAVRYRAEVRRGGGPATVETLVGMAQRDAMPAGVAVVADDHDARVGVWAYPHDPWLPGLAAAASPGSVRGLLTDLGVAAGPVAVRPQVYRPTSRAVLAVHGAADVHVKVVRPDATSALAAAHARLAGALPVPASLGVSERHGVVVLATCPGEPLGVALRCGRPLPSPQALAALLTGVAEHEPPAPATEPAVAARAAAGTVAALAPEAAGRAEAVATEIAERPYRPDRTVHGDFYEAQVLIADGTVTGLLDVDGLRAGDGVDDVATLLAHLDVVAWLDPRSAERVRGFGEAVRRQVVGDDDGATDLRTAGTLLSLAAWPFRAQLPGWRAQVCAIVDLAEQRLERGRRLGDTGRAGGDGHRIRPRPSAMPRPSPTSPASTPSRPDREETPCPRATGS